MANWKEIVHIGDLHDRYKKDLLSPSQLGIAVAQRLAASKYGKDEEIQEIVEELQYNVETIDDYDYILREVYDFGDLDHRIWIETQEQK